MQNAGTAGRDVLSVHACHSLSSELGGSWSGVWPIGSTMPSRLDRQAFGDHETVLPACATLADATQMHFHLSTSVGRHVDFLGDEPGMDPCGLFQRVLHVPCDWCRRRWPGKLAPLEEALGLPQRFLLSIDGDLAKRRICRIVGRASYGSWTAANTAAGASRRTTSIVRRSTLRRR